MVPKIVGVIQNPVGLPTLVLEDGLLPARLVCCSRARLEMGVARVHHFKNCHELISSLSEALSWLHRKHLVHIEVSLDSVTVSF